MNLEDTLEHPLSPIQENTDKAYYLIRCGKFNGLKELIKENQRAGLPELHLEKLVQGPYLNMLMSEDTEKLTNYLREFQEATGIKPTLSEETVQEEYSSLCKRRGLKSFEKLYKRSGIKPSEETVQRTYAIFYAKNYSGSIKLLQKITGIKFDLLNLPEQAVQEAYKELLPHLNRGGIREVKKLYDTTGIKPTLSEETVQWAYSYLYRYVKCADFDIEMLQKITGIKPSEDLINNRQ